MKQTKILIIEDDSVSALMLKKLLDRLQMSSSAYVSSEDALLRLEQEAFDLVFLAPNGHKETGNKLALHIQQLYLIPVVYCLDETNRYSNFPLAIQSFILKPYIKEQLEQVLKESIERLKLWRAALSSLEAQPVLDMLYDALGIGFCVNNLEGYFLRANNNYKQSHIGSNEPLEGQHFRRMLSPDIHEQAETSFAHFQGQAVLAKPSLVPIYTASGEIATSYVVMSELQLLRGRETLRCSTVWGLNTLKPQKDIVAVHQQNILQIQRVQYKIHQLSSVVFPDSSYVQSHKALHALLQSNHLRLSVLLFAERHRQKEEQRGNWLVDMRPYLHSILDELSLAYPKPYIKIERDIDVFALDYQRALGFALLFEELASNALRHAFEDEEHGVLQLVAKQVGEKKYQLICSDTGAQFYKKLHAPLYKSIGLQIIHTVAQHLGFAMQLEEKAGACTWSILCTL